MTPKGMVHALQRIHGCLLPRGVLIDIHPAGEMPPLFLRTEAGQSLIGWYEETDYFIEYRQADAAIAQAVTAGLFRIEEHHEFLFETQAGDIAELANFLTANWSDAVLEKRLIKRAGRMQRQVAGPSKVLLAERVQILRLVALRED
jgi:hypothetical protein